jgi:outer membrane protein assembly factor BamB
MKSVIATLVLVSAIVANTGAADKFWPQWRGPDATGASKLADPPTEWAEGKNIKWKVEIAGRGSSSPVVWENQIFLLTAIPVDPAAGDPHAARGSQKPRGVHKYVVLAIDRRTGKTLWERVAREESPSEGTHGEFGTWASSSAVTDGEHVIANFESQGLYAYDMKGTLVWQKDLGDKTMRNEFGEGSTPALYGKYLVLVWDHQGQSFIVALDKKTGNELWRVTRDEIDSWATPLIVESGGKAQVVTSGMKRVRSYDLETGQLVWDSAGVTMNPIPSPVAADGMVYVTSGFRGSNLKAIKLADAKGDITSTPAIVWSLDRDTPYVPSPLLYEGVIYLLKSNTAVLSAFEAKTGKPHYQLQRLEGVQEVFASPVAAGGRVYITGRDGTTLVLKQGAAFEVLATNSLDDGFDASPALVDKELYLRGHKYLYCVAAK